MFWRIIILIPLLFGLVLTDDACPNFSPFFPWTKECLWFPVEEMRTQALSACGLQSLAASLPPMPMPPALVNAIPPRCGGCSFKLRCQVRNPQPGCIPFNGEKQVCEEYTQPCSVPKNPALNDCDWNWILETVKQCAVRPDLPEWIRESVKKVAETMLPESNCVEKDGQCHCCCHPFKPSPDGSSCIKQNEPKCSDWPEWNDWSDCLWYPVSNLIDTFKSHCAVRAKAVQSPDLPLPSGFSPPEKCGFCSFRIRCRKRSQKDENGKKRCFPLEADKKACGPSDCPTCGNVCELPKILDSCNYGKHLKTFLSLKLKNLKKLPYWRQHGITRILKYLPAGECIEKDGKCICCCNPYMPNQDGTACVFKEYCNMPMGG